LTDSTIHSFAALALALIAGVASAQSDKPWDGFYAGPNAGGAWNNTCSSWTLTGAVIDPATATAIYNRGCATSTLVGGVQFGDNFQYRRFFWGIGVDVEVSSAKSHNQALKYTGPMPPPGAYVFSDKPSSSGFGLIGPRIGYAGNEWLPYITVGAIATFGSRLSSLSYTPAGATKPTASFSGGNDFAATGWFAGGGAEWGLNGPWSITVEYLHANLGRGSGYTTTCRGGAAACAAFSGISLDSVHDSFGTNIFRVGINYWFGYWEP
jgi:outer membrane immunogenic protein